MLITASRLRSFILNDMMYFYTLKRLYYGCLFSSVVSCSVVICNPTYNRSTLVKLRWQFLRQMLRQVRTTFEWIRVVLTHLPIQGVPSKVLIISLRTAAIQAELMHNGLLIL